MGRYPTAVELKTSMRSQMVPLANGVLPRHWTTRNLEACLFVGPRRMKLKVMLKVQIPIILFSVQKHSSDPN